MKFTGYHGLTHSGPLTGEWWSQEMYIAYEESLARDASLNGLIYTVEYDSHITLILASPEQFIEVWVECGASREGRSFPDQKELLCNWARRLGFDAICIPPSAFEGELGYEWVAGTFGEPQMILLDPNRAVMVRHQPMGSPTTIPVFGSRVVISSHPTQLWEEEAKC